MKIPFSPPYNDPDVEAEVLDALRSGWITTGPKVKALEQAVCNYVNVPETLGVNSATSGMMLALHWFGITRGDEVIVPAYTYCATALSVMHIGAKPVMVDVCGDFNAFRKLLGLIKYDGKIAHHLIPLGEETHNIVQLAATAGFDMNSATNAIALDKLIHTGNHHIYSNNVRQAMTGIETSLGTSITPQQAKQALESLIDRIRAAIAANPGINIDNLIF